MLEIMREGGANMWLMLCTAMAFSVWALRKDQNQRFHILACGAFVLLMEGMLGISVGLIAVSKHYQSFPDPLSALGEGLHELSHNGIFSVILSGCLGLWAIFSRKRIFSAVSPLNH